MPVPAPDATPDFEKQGGLLPAVIQDDRTGRVLMLGYMDRPAFEATLREGRVHFFSRSKGRMWMKGESSGNVLSASEVRLDCDRDTLLVRARPSGPVCHTGADTCFFEVNAPNSLFLEHLEAFLRDRKENPVPDSHTSAMFEKGLNKITQKFGEEAVELVIEAKDDDRERFTNEAADLLYRLTTLLVEKDISFAEIMAVLQARHNA